MNKDNLSYANLQSRILNTLALKEDLEARIKEELSYSDFNTENVKELAAFMQSLLNVIDTHLKWYYHKETLQKISEEVEHSLNLLRQYREAVSLNDVANGPDYLLVD